MKKSILLILFLLLALAASSVFAEDQVGAVGDICDCGDMAVRLTTDPKVTTIINGRNTRNGTFVTLRIELTYISDTYWKALDKGSFSLINITDGARKEYPLDYITTMVASEINQTDTILEDLEFPEIRNYMLIFDVDKDLHTGWSLHFTPMERGTTAAYCDKEMPLPKF